MSKFKLSLPLKIADVRENLLRMQQELSLLKSSYRQAGLTAAQGQMLMEIERSAPITVVALTGLLGLDKSTVSQTLSQLQRNGWVEMRENEQDRRYKTITLTAAGEERVVNLHAKFDEQLNDLFSDLKDQEKNAIGFGIGIFAAQLESRRVQKNTVQESTETPARTEFHPLYHKAVEL